jgi:predicted enzyme related to lactoylglutathione lyase
MPPARDEYPPGVPCWIDIGPPDPEAAAAFYGELFGWELVDRGGYVVARMDGLDVAGVGSRPGVPPAAAWNTYVAVERADDAAATAQAAGGTVLVAAFDIGEAGRTAVLADPTGAAFRVWEVWGSAAGAQLVNAPGTWNWSGLQTSDVEGAKAFYGAVFGWEVDAMGMVRRPGYGEFLERYDPGVRQRHRDAGAPEGFTDAVAWMRPLSGDEAPHWSVTFSVDDADAIAARTEVLGGKVVTPPVDSEWVRETVLRDPQGAEFTASKFKPPA